MKTLVGLLLLSLALPGCSARHTLNGPYTLEFAKPVPLAGYEAREVNFSGDGLLLLPEVVLQDRLPWSRSSNGGTTWTAGQSPLEGASSAQPIYGDATGLLSDGGSNYLLALDQEARLVAAQGRGDSWKLHRQGPTTEPSTNRNATFHGDAGGGRLAAVKGFDGLSFQLFTSADGGATWKAKVHQLEQADLKSYTSSNYRFMVDLAGRLHLLLGEVDLEGKERREGVLYLRSTDGETFTQTYTEGERINVALGMGLNRARPDELYRTEVQQVEKKGLVAEQSHVLSLSVSTDGGQSWGKPFPIEQGGEKYDVQVQGHGDTLVCCWTNSATRGSELRYVASVDGGKSWSGAETLFDKADDELQLLVGPETVTIVAKDESVSPRNREKLKVFVGRRR